MIRIAVLSGALPILVCGCTEHPQASMKGEIKIDNVQPADYFKNKKNADIEQLNSDVPQRYPGKQKALRRTAHEREVGRLEIPEKSSRSEHELTELGCQRTCPASAEHPPE